MKLRIVLLWMAVAVLMATIFWFSSQPGTQSNHVSEGLSKRFVEQNPTTKALTDNHKENKIVTVNGFFRKYAHYMVFLLLGIAVSLALRSSFGAMRTPVVWAIALGFCLLYAVSDEIHQHFVPERSAQLTDVLIDFCGAFTGSTTVLLIKSLFGWIRPRTVRKISS